MVTQIGHAKLALLMSLGGLFKPEPKTTATRVTANDTPHFGCPRVPTARLCAPCARLLWVQSRVETLAVAVPIVVGHFQPVIYKAPTSVSWKWPITFRSRPELDHGGFSQASCAVYREADLQTQSWIFARSSSLHWLMIFLVLCPIEVARPIKWATNYARTRISQ